MTGVNVAPDTDQVILEALDFDTPCDQSHCDTTAAWIITVRLRACGCLHVHVHCETCKDDRLAYFDETCPGLHCGKCGTSSASVFSRIRDHIDIESIEPIRPGADQ